MGSIQNKRPGMQLLLEVCAHPFLTLLVLFFVAAGVAAGKSAYLQLGGAGLAIGGYTVQRTGAALALLRAAALNLLLYLSAGLLARVRFLAPLGLICIGAKAFFAGYGVKAIFAAQEGALLRAVLHTALCVVLPAFCCSAAIAMYWCAVQARRFEATRLRAVLLAAAILLEGIAALWLASLD